MSIQAQHLAVLARKRASGYGAAAQAYIDAIETAGATPTTAEKDAIDTFYGTVDMTLWKRLYMPVWAAAAPNAVDMVDSSRSGTWNGGVTHTAGEATGNGTTGYLDLGATPDGSGMGITNACLVHYCPDDTAENSYDIGAGQSAKQCQAAQYNTTTYWQIGTTTRSTTSTPRVGVVFFNSNSTATSVNVRDTSGITEIQTAAAAPGTTLATVNVFGAGWNNNGSLNNPSARDHSLFGMGLGHTSGQRTTFLDAAYTMLNSFTTHKPTMV